MIERINKCSQSALSVLSTGWNSINVSSSLLSSSFQPRLSWHDLPSKQCQDSGEAASPFWFQRKEMHPLQFEEFGHGRRRGNPSVPEFILRPMARQSQMKTGANWQPGWGPLWDSSRVSRKWSLRAGPTAPVFSCRVTLNEGVRRSREGCRGHPPLEKRHRALQPLYACAECRILESKLVRGMKNPDCH